MPPSLPPTPRTNPPDSQIIESTEESLPQDHVLALFDVEGAGLALARCQFDVEELITRMVDHVRDPNPTISGPAIKRLLTHLKDVASLNGLIGRTQLKETRAHGNHATVTQSVQGETLQSRLGNRPGVNTVPLEFLPGRPNFKPPAPTEPSPAPGPLDPPEVRPDGDGEVPPESYST